MFGKFSTTFTKMCYKVEELEQIFFKVCVERFEGQTKLVGYASKAIPNSRNFSKMLELEKDINKFLKIE